ncbi:carboxypeptidase regulatory-like domain-containing protein [Hymenobacter psoromatis]|uniref:carboxypeptidase regulatory-like domain-containing protein n=1 Tax=Hymenobacter psoromatis TaxID=1484116 RepID=UPI001CBF8708|nr:carboxypeptidase regulatory-like domain-containing protein [Hymenobacter psoromatis]
MPANQIFKPGTRELLPTTRDAYLRNALDPAEARAIEQVLAADSVERGVTLARYHELAQLAQVPSPPQWVRRQLRRQPSVSAWGPLRRPVLRLALGLLLLLGGFSVVQWVRNQPLVPVPVVAAFQRTINSAAQGLGRPVVYTPAELAATLAPEKPVPAALARPARVPRASRRAPRAAIRELASQPITPISVLIPPPADTSDSLRQRGAALAGSDKASPVLRVVRGFIYDPLGKPLAGATVLVKGTTQVAVTTVTGVYEVSVPLGAVLEVGYAGYQDETMQTGQETAVDVTLQPLGQRERRKMRGAHPR